MCTLAWLRRPGGYQFWHSRDEQLSRGVAVPPRVEHAAGSGWIAPRDSDAGGTWVGVNTQGVTVGIANLFPGSAPEVSGRRVSRGLLVRELLGSPTRKQVERRLHATDLSPFDAFTLVTLEPDQEPQLLRWDRTSLRRVEPLGPTLLVTSAGGSRVIEEGRMALFAGLAGEPSADQVEALYRSPPTGSAASICVHHERVSTVSLTRIDVTSLRVGLAYTAGYPCLSPAGPAIVLDRTHVAFTPA